MSPETVWGNFTLFDQSLNCSNESVYPLMCTFKKVENIWDFITLFEHRECFRQTVEYTVFLGIVNLIVLVFGIVGNLLVIYVVVFRIKTKTASSIFILNLAVADLLKIVCCIPVTLVANLIIPWVFSEAICKITTYSQGVSVFCSGYSLLAISFDRFRAIHQSLGLTPNISVRQSYIIVSVIWVLGLLATLPWAVVFEVIHQNPYKHASPEFMYDAQYNLPFCQEVWQTKTQEIVYFVFVHFFACFLLPFILIAVFNVIIWREVLNCRNLHASGTTCQFPHLNEKCLKTTQHKRKVRMLKMFTGLTAAFFICWFPLYLITGRVKLYYTETYIGGVFEQWLVPILMPVAQLLGNVNSCINPVLYALLNQNFRKSFNLICKCPWFSLMKNARPVTNLEEHNSVALVVQAKLQTRSSRV